METTNCLIQEIRILSPVLFKDKSHLPFLEKGLNCEDVPGNSATITEMQKSKWKDANIKMKSKIDRGQGVRNVCVRGGGVKKS